MADDGIDLRALGLASAPGGLKVEMRFDESQLMSARATLAAYPGTIDRVQNAAINATLRKTRTFIRKFLSTKYNIRKDLGKRPSSIILKRMKLWPANKSGGGKLRLGGRTTASELFPSQQGKAGLNILWRKSGLGQYEKGAFKAQHKDGTPVLTPHGDWTLQPHIFRRKTKKRFPIKRIGVPGFADTVAQAPAMLRVVQNFIDAHLSNELTRRVEFALTAKNNFLRTGKSVKQKTPPPEPANADV